MIGTLGDTVFTVSTDRVFTFRGLSRSGAPRIEEHAVIGRKPVLEFSGPGLEQVTFSIRLDAFLGVNPMEEIKQIRSARDLGKIQSLVIAGEYWGRWIIMSAEETHSRHDGSGRLIVADISITLKEVADNGEL